MTENLSRLTDAGVNYLSVHDAIYTPLSQVVETQRGDEVSVQGNGG